MNGLTGKRIVVTGAARGIGAALSAELRARGAAAITADVTAGADMTCDVSDAGQVSAMFAEVGNVDGLVNCAALLVSRKAYHEIDLDEWDRMQWKWSRDQVRRTRRHQVEHAEQPVNAAVR